MNNQLPLLAAQGLAALSTLAVGLSAANPAVGEAIVEMLETQVDRQGRKFTKVESLYLPVTPLPPLFWRYECQTCRFWQEAKGEWGECEVVGVPNDPFGGEKINRLAWCGFWVNRQDDLPLQWPADLLGPG